MAVTVEVNQEDPGLPALLDLPLERAPDPGVEGVVDQLGLLTSPLDSDLGQRPVGLHLAPVHVTLYDVGPHPLLTEQPLHLPGDHLCAGVPGVGQRGELGGALPRLDQVPRLTQDVARRRGVAA